MPYTHEGPPLYRTVDDRVVEEGDPDAAFLLIGTGGQMSDEEAAKWGLGQDAPQRGQAAQDAQKDTQAGESPKGGRGGSQDKARRGAAETKAGDEPKGGLKINRE